MNPASEVKRKALIELLERGVTMVHVDPRRPGVEVPAPFNTWPIVRLNLSWKFDDVAMDITDESVSATLSFSKTCHRVTLPWASIFAMNHGTKYTALWAPDAPPEAELVSAVAPAPARRSERHLRLVN